MKHTVLGIAALFLTALFCGAALADGPTYTFGLTPYAGYHWINDRDYEDKPEAGLRAEMFFTPRWSAEVGVGYMRMERQSTGAKKDGITYLLNAVYNLSVSGKVIPYLTAGLGGDYTDGKGLAGPDAGIGVRIALTDTVQLKPEVRYINLFKGREDLVATLGISFLFGKTAAAAAPAAAPAPKPAPVAEPAAAPAVAPVVAAAPPDSDKDGVPDSIDKCPGTPAGAAVDADGCPLDSDKDGVPDYLDKCPGTPAGARIDKEGCVVSITLKVNFDPGKAIIKKEYLPEIERFAQFLKQYPDVKAEIQGHTDNTGSAKKNVILSDARAKAVRDAVVSRFGIAADRITAKGYGQERPVASNDTQEGREQNRRVEAVIIK